MPSALLFGKWHMNLQGCFNLYVFDVSVQWMWHPSSFVFLLQPKHSALLHYLIWLSGWICIGPWAQQAPRTESFSIIFQRWRRNIKKKKTPRMSKCSIINIYQTKLKLPNWSDIVAIFAMPTEPSAGLSKIQHFHFTCFVHWTAEKNKVMAFLQKRTIFHIYIYVICII